MPPLASLPALRAHLAALGWASVEVLPMDVLEHSRFFSADDARRVRALAALDEYEEWRLVASHYYLAILKNT